VQIHGFAKSKKTAGGYQFHGYLHSIASNSGLDFASPIDAMSGHRVLNNSILMVSEDSSGAAQSRVRHSNPQSPSPQGMNYYFEITLTSMYELLL
jgi:hypothetical protein